MKIITSWDDGRKQDFRLAELLKKYQLPAIFYIPANCEIGRDGILELARDFEIGSHTLSHTLLTRIPLAKAEREIIGGKSILKAVLNKEITKFCYPRGYYNEEIKQLVRLAGFKEARTTKVLYTNVDDPFETNTSVHIYNRKEYGDDGWMKVALEMLDKTKYENGIYHLWSHSWEIDKYDWWEPLEQLFKIIREEL